MNPLEELKKIAYRHALTLFRLFRSEEDLNKLQEMRNVYKQTFRYVRISSREYKLKLAEQIKKRVTAFYILRAKSKENKQLLSTNERAVAIAYGIAIAKALKEAK